MLTPNEDPSEQSLLLSSTVLATLKMYKEGSSIEDISAKRGLHKSTIKVHLSKIIDEDVKIDREGLQLDENLIKFLQTMNRPNDDISKEKLFVETETKTKIDWGDFRLARSVSLKSQSRSPVF